MSVAPEPIHLIADLEQWSYAGTALAVVGQPVAHSLSPEMHNAALAELARTRPEFAQWRYFKFEIAAPELERALKLFHRHRFQGLNLTVPHKALVVDHLNSKDPFVQAAGAANTLKNNGDWWRGFNTDGIGLTAALREDLGVELAGAQVVLLGAGGAARGAAIECLRVRCASLWIGNRTRASLDELLESLQPFAAGTELHGFEIGNPPGSLPPGSIVINATSLGLATGDAAPLDLKKIPPPACVYDMIYRPPQTALLRQAAGLGIRNANGLSMLVHQGAKSLELWTGATAPVDVMRQAARAALGTN